MNLFISGTAFALLLFVQLSKTEPTHVTLIDCSVPYVCDLCVPSFCYYDTACGKPRVASSFVNHDNIPRAKCSPFVTVAP